MPRMGQLFGMHKGFYLYLANQCTFNKTYDPRKVGTSTLCELPGLLR